MNDKENKNLNNIEEQSEKKLSGISEDLISAGVVSDNEEMALDDERRVKVLSPGALVRRRFLRNRLAIVGLIILLLMFAFSYIGGLLSPYGEMEQFTKGRPIMKDFAGITYNENLRYIVGEGVKFESAAQAQLIKQKNAGKDNFTYNGTNYSFEPVGEESYFIHSSTDIAKGLVTGMIAKLNGVGDFKPSKEFNQAVAKAVKAKEDTMEWEGETLSIQKGKGKEYTVGRPGIIAVASPKVLSFDSPEAEESLELRVALEKALAEGADNFDYNEENYTLEKNDENVEIYKDDALIAVLSNYIVQPIFDGDFLNLDYKRTALEAVNNNDTSFTFTSQDGEEVNYRLDRKNIKWDVKKEQISRVYDAYAYPSAEHALGTDANGMDLLTRLMYGGRISLMVGFIVVAIAMTIGVIMGGISGFFGGWVDMVIMRIVDIFYCIPTYPILIILGSIMDQLDMKSTPRMIALMVVLGLLGWAGTARMVRGQILMLREEEYMVAAESTGLSYSRRILKHLIPNVMPLLIVSATMSLGGTILTESTLSFLGLGVKYPYASWGNIINAVSNQHVMTQYPFVWIPAGICIVLTVVAFNFVGDGLRDAYDPKMKR